MAESMKTKSRCCFSCFPSLSSTKPWSSQEAEPQIPPIHAHVSLHAPSVPSSSQPNPSTLTGNDVLEGVSSESSNTNLQPAPSSSSSVPSAAAASSSQPNPSPVVDNNILESGSSESSNTNLQVVASSSPNVLSAAASCSSQLNASPTGVSSESSNAMLPRTSSEVTVQDLTYKIRDDAENVSVDIDALIKDIRDLLDAKKKEKKSDQAPKPNESDKKRKQTIHSFWPTTSLGFLKLKDLLEGVYSLKDTVNPSEETKKVIREILYGIGKVHWATAGLIVVAVVLERLETNSKNRAECLDVLNALYKLGIYFKEIKAQDSLREDTIKEGTELIVEGSLLCCYQINRTGFSRFFTTSVDKNDLLEFQKRLQYMYRDLDNQLFISTHKEIIKNHKKSRPEKRPYPEHAVGLEEQLKDVIGLLVGGEDKALAVILYGFGGMGKSTLAEAAFAELKIEGCIYSKVTLFDDTTATPNIVELQKHILHNLTIGVEEEETTITDFRDGQQAIGEMLEKVVACIYIDNVLDIDCLEKLLPVDTKKAKSLKVLITARDKNMCIGCKMKTNTYEMKCLLLPPGKILFEKQMQHATNDIKGQLSSNQVEQMVQQCGGIPKLLKVVGGFIGAADDKDKAYRIVMDEIKILEGQVFDKIENYIFSFDNLPEDCKDPFLDVCLFFKGWDWETVADIVGESKLDVLEKRALITKDKSMTLRVHDVILTMGRQKAKNNRFKITDDATANVIEVLSKKELHNIKGLWFTDPIYCHIPATKLKPMCISLRILAHGMVTEHFKDLIFKNMVFYKGKATYFPFQWKQFKELRFLNYQPQDRKILEEMPSTLRHVELDGRLCHDLIEFSDLKLPKLKVLRLTNFERLEKLPTDWGSVIGSLQELTLSRCTSIEELTGSISKLQHLKVLKLDRCWYLKGLPEDFEKLSCLQVLDFSYCFSLEELPKSFSKLQHLKVLRLTKCINLKRLPDDFKELNLEELNLWGCCKDLPGIPAGFGNVLEMDYRPLLENKGILWDLLDRDSDYESDIDNGSEEDNETYLESELWEGC